MNGLIDYLQLMPMFGSDITSNTIIFTYIASADGVDIFLLDTSAELQNDLFSIRMCFRVDENHGAKQKCRRLE